MGEQTCPKPYQRHAQDEQRHCMQRCCEDQSAKGEHSCERSPASEAIRVCAIAQKFSRNGETSQTA